MFRHCLTSLFLQKWCLFVLVSVHICQDIMKYFEESIGPNQMGLGVRAGWRILCAAGKFGDLGHVYMESYHATNWGVNLQLETTVDQGV